MGRCPHRPHPPVKSASVRLMPLARSAFFAPEGPIVNSRVRKPPVAAPIPPSSSESPQPRKGVSRPLRSAEQCGEARVGDAGRNGQPKVGRRGLAQCPKKIPALPVPLVYPRLCRWGSSNVLCKRDPSRSRSRERRAGESHTAGVHNAKPLGCIAVNEKRREINYVSISTSCCAAMAFTIGVYKSTSSCGLSIVTMSA